MGREERQRRRERRREDRRERREDRREERRDGGGGLLGFIDKDNDGRLFDDVFGIVTDPLGSAVGYTRETGRVVHDVLDRDDDGELFDRIRDRRRDDIDAFMQNTPDPVVSAPVPTAFTPTNFQNAPPFPFPDYEKGKCYDNCKTIEDKVKTACEDRNDWFIEEAKKIGCDFKCTTRTNAKTCRAYKRRKSSCKRKKKKKCSCSS